MTALFALSAFALLLFFAGSVLLIAPTPKPMQAVGRHAVCHRYAPHAL